MRYELEDKINERKFYELDNKISSVRRRSLNAEMIFHKEYLILKLD